MPASVDFQVFISFLDKTIQKQKCDTDFIFDCMHEIGNSLICEIQDDAIQKLQTVKNE